MEWRAETFQFNTKGGIILKEACEYIDDNGSARQVMLLVNIYYDDYVPNCTVASDIFCYE